MNLKAWSSKHPRTLAVASALLALGFTPAAPAATIHTQAVQMTCMVHSTGSWCHQAPPAAPAAASIPASHS